jgi:hypothetical protein
MHLDKSDFGLYNLVTYHSVALRIPKISLVYGVREWLLVLLEPLVTIRCTRAIPEAHLGASFPRVESPCKKVRQVVSIKTWNGVYIAQSTRARCHET